MSALLRQRYSTRRMSAACCSIVEALAHPQSKEQFSQARTASTSQLQPRASNPRHYQDRFKAQTQEAEKQRPTTVVEPLQNVARSSSSARSGPSSRNQPRASNPRVYQEQFAALKVEPAPVPVEKPTPAITLETPTPTATATTLAEHFSARNESVPSSNWVKVENIPPLSSLDAMLFGVRNALNIERERGIIDLDAEFNQESLPFLTNIGEEEDWVQSAHVILSPFGRPCGWKLKFENRSIVYALLAHANELEVQCGTRRVRIVGHNPNDQQPEEEVDVSDATIRVENCPDGLRPLALLKLFSRYDLRGTGPSVAEWKGQTNDGLVARNIWLVHFAHASWARAAMRERQSSELQGKTLLLAQFPKQIL
jgi:hypothetical protein